MNFFRWLKGDDIKERITSQEAFLEELGISNGKGIEDTLKAIAYSTAVSTIAAAAASVRWEEYKKNKPYNGREALCWNMRPNVNQTKQAFWLNLVDALYGRGSALVVHIGKSGRYVADSYAEECRLSGNLYNSVVCWGEPLDNQSFSVNDVLRLDLNAVIDIGIGCAEIAEKQGKLIGSATRNYIREKGIRGVFTVDTSKESQRSFEERWNNVLSKRFKRYFEAENAVLPIYLGETFEERATNEGSAKASIVGTRDIKNIYNDVFDLIACMFGIPTSIIYGRQPTEEEISQFERLTVRPLVDAFASEVNMKIFGMEKVISGTYIKPVYAHDHDDVFDVAAAVDKLIGCGVLSINEVREKLGSAAIDEGWAKRHYITKNYAAADALGEGGESNAGTEQTE